jgi:hypothetical protein
VALDLLHNTNLLVALDLLHNTNLSVALDLLHNTNLSVTKSNFVSRFCLIVKINKSIEVDAFLLKNPMLLKSKPNDFLP